MRALTLLHLAEQLRIVPAVEKLWSHNLSLFPWICLCRQLCKILIEECQITTNLFVSHSVTFLVCSESVKARFLMLQL